MATKEQPDALRRLSRQTIGPAVGEPPRWMRAAGSGANVASHHPAPLGDPTVPGEAEFLKQVFRTGVKVGASLRLAALNLFRVGLYESAAGRLDRRKGAAHGCSGDPVATMTLPPEDAADPPVR